MKTATIKIVARTLLVLGVFALSVAAASMRSEKPGVTFACNGIDLRIDSQASYNGIPHPSGIWELKDLVPGVDKFFNFDDIKPGDYGENTVSLHIKNSPAWICLDFKNLQDFENGVNEPESHEDINGESEGDLANGMEFFAWIDDGDNVFELGERPLFSTTTQSATIVLNDTTYAIADAINGSACPKSKTCYFGIYWCAGNLTVDLATAEISCEGEVLGNEAQTDSMSVDVKLRAYPSLQNPYFLCDGRKLEGCTPGYWKQKQHFGDWALPYTPDTLFSSVFENAFPGKTFHQVLNLTGGGLKALGRHAVAALLNSVNPEVDYAFSEAEVIQMFNDVYPGGDYETLKNKFEFYNESFCPLGCVTDKCGDLKVDINIQNEANVINNVKTESNGGNSNSTTTVINQVNQSTIIIGDSVDFIRSLVNRRR